MRKKYTLLLWCMLISAAFLTLCSKSSPLYPMNDWVDVHCFFTVGRSIWDGLVPYADLYEQKGPVLYFLYAIAALISDDSFIGVFLLEVVSFGLFLYFSGKIAQLYLGQCKVIYLITAVLAAVIPISYAFGHGGSVEELCLFMLAYGMYSVLKALQENRVLTFWEAFLNGVFAAMALWIKFTILGFYIGLAAFVIIWYLIPRFQWKELLLTIGQFILGAAAVSSVVFVYFLLNGALEDLFTVYFYNNLFLYPVEVSGSRVDIIWQCFYNAMKYNPTFSPLLGLGLLGLVVGFFRPGKPPLALVMCIVGLAAGTYWGGRGYNYYGMIFAAFAVFGPIVVVQTLRFFRVREGLHKLFRGEAIVGYVALAAAVPLLLVYSFQKSPNTYLLQYEKEDLPQYQFAEIINTVEDATLLNYGFLDGGFYYTADVVPTCKYFCNFNIEAPEMWDEQKECIENGDVDFIVTRYYTLNQYRPNSSQYVLVDEAQLYFEGIVFTYYLYQKTAG